MKYCFIFLKHVEKVKRKEWREGEMEEERRKVKRTI